jgi:hypothetical protein
MEDTDVIRWMEDKILIAERISAQDRIIVFLDEVNTCNAMGLFKVRPPPPGRVLSLPFARSDGVGLSVLSLSLSVSVCLSLPWLSPSAGSVHTHACLCEDT